MKLLPAVLMLALLLGCAQGSPAPMSTKLAISTSSLPAGNLDHSYSVQLQAIGGVAPYRWTIVSGILPSGLNLSSTGLLSGTPTLSGDFNLTIQVTDSALSTAQIHIGGFNEHVS
jgi:Putative Ig domain